MCTVEKVVSFSLFTIPLTDIASRIVYFAD